MAVAWVAQLVVLLEAPSVVPWEAPSVVLWEVPSVVLWEVPWEVPLEEPMAPWQVVWGLRFGQGRWLLQDQWDWASDPWMRRRTTGRKMPE